MFGDFMRAVVLSGGGSKGAYQIGVWKALRQLNIKYEIVAGTSVGALNGAMMVQKNYYKAYKLWSNISMEKMFDGKFENYDDTISLYKEYFKNFVKNKGAKPSGLDTIVTSILNKKRFYNSKIDFGLITFNKTNKKPKILQKKDIPENKLKDYLIASSSAYPAFTTREIEGKEFIDGGYYDNIPINLAIDMGADEAIVVDLTTIGLRKATKKKIKTIKIIPRNDLGSFLLFDKDLARRNIKYGYNDAMKVFNKYEGYKYTFKLHSIEKFKTKYKETFTYTFNKIINSKTAQASIAKLLKIDKDNNSKIIDKILLKALEHVGETLSIDDTKIYSLNKFIKLVKKDLNIRKKYNIKTKGLEIYNLIKEEKYAKVKKEALKKPIDFITALCLYTIDED